MPQAQVLLIWPTEKLKHEEKAVLDEFVVRKLDIQDYEEKTTGTRGR
jgi:hypothetical protein